MKLGDKIQETKYLKFIVITIKPKTVVIGIYNKSQNDCIGEIEWYVSWRQYCFCPAYATVWNKQCLIDVNEVITFLMKNR